MTERVQRETTCAPHEYTKHRVFDKMIKTCAKSSKDYVMCNTSEYECWEL